MLWAGREFGAPQEFGAPETIPAGSETLPDLR